MKNKRVLLFLFALTFLPVGCESREFKAERLMARANKMSVGVTKVSGRTPGTEAVQALEAYRVIVERYPDTPSASQARFGIANLYLVTGEFQKARDEYGKVAQSCGNRRGLCSDALLGVGSSLEAQNRWEEAAAVYKKIMQEYPFTGKSLDLPIRIISHYLRVGDGAGIRTAVDDAVVYYRGLKGRNKAPDAEYILDRYVALAYTQGRQWPEALDSLEKLARDYPKNNPEEALLLKFLIYADKLKDKIKAKEEISRILSDYPGSKIAQKVEDYLKKLEP